MDEWGERGDLFDALIIAERDGAAGEAVRLADGRVVRRLAWRGVADGLNGAGQRPILLIEAEGIADDLLAEALPRIAAAAEMADLQMIVALDQAQIDHVAGHLMGERAQLLVAPTMTDRVSALTIAMQMAGRIALHDRVSEGETARLARLNAEVARIAEVLARLSAREEPGLRRGDVADRRQPYDAGPTSADERIDPVLIRDAIRARRLRDRQFGAGLFEDPAWDMMLDLFAAHLERAQVSVSSLCIAASVAPTTALRWIGKMTDAGLFEREPDPFDRRRAFMALSERALEGMRGYVAACRAQGLPIA